ncbi:MAG: GNAT family protein [Anaerolineae bacterium]
MNTILLEGRRVNLRDWQLDDLDSYAHWLQPGHRWQELDGPYYGHPSAEEIPGILDNIRTRILDGHFTDPRARCIVADAADNHLIGQVSRYWISEETNWIAAGIVLYDPDLWGHGLGFEALGLWTDYLFRSLPQIVRLDLQTWSGNTGMMKLAAKLGYSLEGRFRKARIVAGAYYDALGYGILREEWQAQYPQGFERRPTGR